MGTINNINIYAIFLGLHAVIYGSYDSYLIAMLTTFEKRFSLPSKLSGLIVSMGDIGYLIAVLPVSFYGKRGHRPRCLGFLGLVLSAGVAIMTSPYFIFGPMKMTDAADIQSTNVTKSYDLCLSNGTDALARSVSHGGQTIPTESKIAYGILIFGGLLVGVGSTPFWNLGLAYIDDHVPKIRAPVYISAMMALRFLAPVPGYITGGELAKVPEDLSKTYRGVGAWWLGLIILGSLTTLTSLTMFLFPRKMKQSYEATKTVDIPMEEEPRKFSSVSMMNGDTTTYISEVISTPNLTKDIFGTVKRTARNLSFITLLIGTAFEFLAFIGFLAFLPKFYEVNFGKSKSVASVSAGLVEGLASALGTLAGGILMNKVPFGLRKILLMTTVACFLGGLFGNVGVFMTCKNTPRVVGINDEIVGSSLHDPMLTCRVQGSMQPCQCGNSLQPACFKNYTFINPCRAGCGLQSPTEYQYQSFEQCGCQQTGLAWSGYCRQDTEDCTMKFWLYNIIYFNLNFIAGSLKIIICMIIIRSINSKDKDIGFGFITFASSAAASLSPILFGSIIDKFCLHFDGAKGDIFAQCQLYNIDGIRISQHVLRSTMRIITAIIFVAAVLASRNNKYIIENEQQIKLERAASKESGEQTEAAV